MSDEELAGDDTPDTNRPEKVNPDAAPPADEEEELESAGGMYPHLPVRPSPDLYADDA